METFLHMVARDLYVKRGNNLGRTVIVFPNKRASLFFNECLASQSELPLWSPAYLSISELFGQLSPYKIGDPIRLVCELYKVFCQATGSEETLDEFYFWGELLIADFDDIDKNLVNASRLFSNLQDLKALMDKNDFLDKEQEESIRRFFRNFSIERHTQLKERFISIWDKLETIYKSFRTKLEEQGIAYEGMIYRQSIEHFDISLLPADCYVFVGFNVLNKVETDLFKHLQNAGRALFYWDYDITYTHIPHNSDLAYTHEAGEFILRNLAMFPNQLPESCFDKLQHPKQISFISAPTENAQARFLPQWYAGLDLNGTDEKENAVVLCNESLLLPVLHALPDSVKDINITMGFPLSQTPAYSLVRTWMELQTEGFRPSTGRYAYHAVLAMLRHPYVRKLSEAAEALESRLIQENRFFPQPSELGSGNFLKQVFAPCQDTADMLKTIAALLHQAASLYRNPDDTPAPLFESQLHQESLFKAFTLANRLLRLVEAGQLAGLQPATLCRLLDRLLTSASIPFHGEPAMGLQVMGVLETRNLDFRNLIVLSLNEGKLPKNEGESSFIPHNLRKAFGMTTVEHKNSIYAYYFYRLIQRAKNVTLLYNTSSDGLNRSEMSRFMRQLQVECRYPIALQYLDANQKPQTTLPMQVEKTPAMLERMRHTYDTRTGKGITLSPSALNAYLDCPISFYFRYVVRLGTPDEVSPDIDSAMFGTLFHRAAELAYGDLTRHGANIRKEDLEQLLKDDVRLEAYINRAFSEDFFHLPQGKTPEYNGIQLIHAKVIASYLKQLLRYDLRRAPFYMEGMEQRIKEDLDITTPAGTLSLRIGGIVDRMDSKDGTLYLIDYKTGGNPKTPTDIDQLFQPGDTRPAHVFQTFLYASILCRKQPLRVAPALFYIHRAAADTYSPVIKMGPARQRKPVDDFAPYEQEFREQLQALLCEIFSPDKPFTQTESTTRCAYCDFRKLCHR